MGDPMISAHQGCGDTVDRARSKEWPPWLSQEEVRLRLPSPWLSRLTPEEEEEEQSLREAKEWPPWLSHYKEEVRLRLPSPWLSRLTPEEEEEEQSLREARARAKEEVRRMFEAFQRMPEEGNHVTKNILMIIFSSQGTEDNNGSMHKPLVRMMLFGGSSICPSHSSAPHNGYQAGTTDAKGNHVTKNILMIRSSSQGTEDNNGSINEKTVFILDSESHVNVTGVFPSSIDVERENVVLIAANGDPMETFYSGSIRDDRFELHNVHYCPDVGNRIIISGSRLDTLGYFYGFGEGKCIVTDLSTGKVVGKGHLVDGRDYIMDYLRIPRDRVFVPRPQEPALVISVWKTICSGFRTFTGLMFRRASTQTPRRPPV